MTEEFSKKEWHAIVFALESAEINIVTRLADGTIRIANDAYLELIHFLRMKIETDLMEQKP